MRSQNSTIGLLMAKLEKFCSFPATLSCLWPPFEAFHMLEGESLDSEVNVLNALIASTGTAIASLSQQLSSAVEASLDKHLSSQLLAHLSSASKADLANHDKTVQERLEASTASTNEKLCSAFELLNDTFSKQIKDNIGILL